MDRKAALQMSVQSIVTFVLAFIVMGLLIGVIQVMFSQIEGQVELIPSPGVELGGRPTADRPFLVQNGEIVLRKGQSRNVYFGVYNTLERDVKIGDPWIFDVVGCVGFEPGDDPDFEVQASVYFHERSIQQGDVITFQTVVRSDNNAVVRGSKYTCYGAVYDLYGPDVTTAEVDVGTATAQIAGAPNPTATELIDPTSAEPFAFGSFILTIQ